jgi:transposase
MPSDLIDDDFWALIEPLLPSRSTCDNRYAGRKPAPDRATFAGIVFVLRSGISWYMLPRELGYGSGAVCCRRLATWQEAGVWADIQATLFAELLRRGHADVARAISGSLSIREVLTGNRTPGSLRPKVPEQKQRQP